VADVSQAVQQTAEEAGFGVVRKYTGHGIGSKLHEEPQVPNYVSSTPFSRGPVLPRGATLAIEPMVTEGSYHVRVLEDGWTVVTQDGKRCAHFEHTIAVEDYGGVILTAH
jgi:methionyl aminopeptidase